MSSFCIYRYAFFVSFLYASIIQIFDTIFPVIVVCLYMCFACLFNYEKSDPVISKINGVLYYDDIAATCSQLNIFKIDCHFSFVIYNGR